MLSAVWRSYIARLFFTHHAYQRRQPARRAPRFRARLEELERRLAPASFSVNAQLVVTGPANPGAITGGAHAVVFFESGVADYQTLWQGLGAGTDAVLLDSGGDGFREMAAFLAARHDLTAIGVVAHGAPGIMSLGTATLDAASLAAYTRELAVVRSALGPAGELDLWSCDVAAGQPGASLVRDLAAATGAGVAAANHAVGMAALGGNWQLAVRVAGAGGDVPLGKVPFSAAALGSFHGLLDLVVNSGKTYTFNATEPGSVYVRDNPSPPPLTTTFDMIGGSIGFGGGGNLNAYNSSVVHISNGSIGYGGGNLNTYDSSVVSVSGGSVAYVGSLNAHNSSVVNISGGSVAYAGRANAYDASKINISGGSVADSGSMDAYSFGVIAISGTGFNLPYGVVTQTSGNLSGTLADGSSLNVQFATFSHGQIVLSQPSKPTPTVSETASGGVYNGLPYAVTAAAVTGNGNQTLASFGDPSLSYIYYAGATVAGSGSASAPTNAGTYTVVAHWASNNPNYQSADSAPATFVIAPAPLTVTGITANDKVYDSTTKAALNTGSAALAGTVYAGDVVTLVTSGAAGSFASKDAGSGITVNVSGLKLGGARAADYTLNQPSATANITPAPLTVTGIAANDKAYDSTTKAALSTGSAALVGVFPADMATLNTAGATGTFASKDVGTGITVNVSGLTLGGAQRSDYTLTQPATTANITPAPITVTADQKAKVYGAADPSLNYQITAGSLFSGDAITGALSRAPGENVGAYAIQQGTLALGGNYALTYVAADLTIGQRSITVTADSKTKVFGVADPPLTYQITAGTLVAGDAFTGALTRAAGESTGSYPIEQGTLALGGNYALTYIGANLTISQRAVAVTVSADAKSKVYGAADPPLTYQISAGSLLPGDSFTGALTRAPGENVGSYAILQGTLALSANYTLTFVGANLTIAQRAVTVTADVRSRVYGAADPALTYQVTAGSLVAGDAFTGALTRAPGESVGSYAIHQGTLALSNNYTLTFVGANLTIGQRAVTITSDAKSKVYGAADPALTYQITAGSLVPGDAFSGALTRAPGENVGSYAIQQGTLALGGNYSLAYVGAKLSIGQRSITVTADAKSKPLGAVDPPLTYHITTGSLVAGDAFTGALTRAPGESVGSYVIKKGTLALGGNYALTYVGANLTVTPAIPTTQLVISNLSTTSVVLRGTVTFTVTAEDSAGHTVPDYNGTVQLSSTDGQAFALGGLPASYTFVASDHGSHTFAVTLVSSGSQTVTVTDQAINSLAATTSPIIVSVPPNHFVVSVLGGTKVAAGSSFLFTVQAVDQAGNPISNYNGPGSVTITAAPNDLLSNLPITGTLDSSGFGFFQGTLKTAGTYTLVAAAGSYAGASGSITVTPSVPIYFKVTAPAGATTGSPVNVTVTALDLYGNIATGYSGNAHFTSSDSSAVLPADTTLAGGVGTFNVKLDSAGNQTITATDTAATAPPITGTSAAITTRGLTVTSFMPTATGFTATFSKPFLPGDVTLYGTDVSTIQDVMLVGASVGPIHGSLIIDPSYTSVTFNATANSLLVMNSSSSVVLPDDTYTVTLISGSGSNGFLDALGVGLDGTNAGSPANFTTKFTTHYVASAAPVLSIPDFARGPSVAGGPIKVPNDTAQGIPITLYNAAGVTNVTFTLSYDPSLFSALDASSGDATDPASSFTLLSAPTITDSNHATADFEFSDVAPQSGTVVLGDIVAVVPTGAAQNYKAKELLGLGNIVINQGATTGAVSANGVHVNAFFGDVTGNGGIDALDVATAITVAQGTATGFAAYQLLDPAIVGDVALDYAIDAGDVSDLADYTVGLPAPEIPTISTDFSITPTGPDPTLSLGEPQKQGDKVTNGGDSVSLSPGHLVTVSVFLDHPHPQGSTGMTEAILALTYDPSILSVAPSDITLGSIPGLGTGWQIHSVVDQAAGQIGIELYSTTAISSTEAGSLGNIAFHVTADTPGELTPRHSPFVQLVSSVDLYGRQFTTQVDDAQSPFVLGLGVDRLDMLTGRRIARPHRRTD